MKKKPGKALQATSNKVHMQSCKKVELNNNNNMLYMYWELGRFPLNLYYTYTCIFGNI